MFHFLRRDTDNALYRRPPYSHECQADRDTRDNATARSRAAYRCLTHARQRLTTDCPGVLPATALAPHPPPAPNCPALPFLDTGLLTPQAGNVLRPAIPIPACHVTFLLKHLRRRLRLRKHCLSLLMMVVVHDWQQQRQDEQPRLLSAKLP
jgi:hypothetical protein